MNNTRKERILEKVAGFNKWLAKAEALFGKNEARMPPTVFLRRNAGKNGPAWMRSEQLNPDRAAAMARGTRSFGQQLKRDMRKYIPTANAEDTLGSKFRSRLAELKAKKNAKPEKPWWQKKSY